MTTRMSLLSVGMVAGVALVATGAGGADLQPMAVINITGGLHIEQSVPCASDVDLTTPVTDGRFELTPSEGIPQVGGRLFTLTRMNVTFAPFSVTRSCFFVSETRSYGETRVQLAQAVSFTASPTSTPDEFAFVIPKDQFLVYYVTAVNGKSEVAYKRPQQDVTATINLAAGTMQMHAVFATRVHFKVGPIDEVRFGTMTADLAGTIAFPDTDGDGVPDRSDNCRFVANPTQSPVATPLVTPPPDITLTSCLDHAIGAAFAADRCDGGPVTLSNNAPELFAVGPNTVTWTATDAKNRTGSATQIVTVVDTTPPTVTCTPINPTGSSFRVSAVDICTQSPVIRLGSVVLAEGETIMINETGQPGVRLHKVLGATGIRHFHVGPGEAVITATDESNNVGTVACPVPR